MPSAPLPNPSGDTRPSILRRPPETTPRGDSDPPWSSSLRRQLAGTHWLTLVSLVVLLTAVVLAQLWITGVEFPADVGRDVGGAVDDAVKWLTQEVSWLFDGISNAITIVLVKLQQGLLWMPWSMLIIVVGLLAWRTVGWLAAWFAVAALLFIGFMGLWDSAMETLALVITSVSLALLIGIPLGIAGARSRLVESLTRPFLDVMQTMPIFVYLVPAVLFFGLGNVPAVMATIIYAVPPSIRLTTLGIRQVSPEVVEAARSFGTTPTQLLLKVQMPMALPTIMAGVNQTTMLALAMVVVAAMVSAGGLGEDVLRATNRQEPGNSVIAGLSIVLLAIIIDRITQSVAKGRKILAE